MPRKRSPKKKSEVPSTEEASAEQYQLETNESLSAEALPADDAVPVQEGVPDAASSPNDGDATIRHSGSAVRSGVEARLAERETRRVKTVVHFRESHVDSWKETIEVETVSRNGACLVLPRPCPVGRIVSLVMDMPRELRSYDHFAEVYPVAGVVQNCTEVMTDDEIRYHVGIAFIGKQLPDSYRMNPANKYRISGTGASGLWQVVEAGKDFADRRHVRYWQCLVVSVTYRDGVQKMTRRAAVKTRDVSRGGMSVMGPLDVAVGDRIKISSKAHAFFSMATVRNRTDHPRDETRSLVHVQFEGAEFPVDQLKPWDGEEKPAEIEVE